MESHIIVEGYPQRFTLFDIDKALQQACQASEATKKQINVILPPKEIVLDGEILVKGKIRLKGQRTVLQFTETGILKIYDEVYIEGIECQRIKSSNMNTFLVRGHLICSDVIFTSCRISTEGSGSVDLLESNACKISKSNTISTNKGKYLFRTGVATDIGGGHQNQDRFCCFRAGSQNEHLVMAVFDGHGMELGEIAAVTARNCIEKYLRNVHVLENLEKDPQGVFDRVFHDAHLKIKEVFRQQSQLFGKWQVFESQNGYLVKRQKVQSANGVQVYETNVHGGTTATIVVVYDSRKVFVANVGDSTALFGGLDKDGNSHYTELSAEHSPESLEEFKRVKLAASKHDATSLIEHDSRTLWFVYDEIQKTQYSSPKHVCPPIFKLDYATGSCKRTSNNGSYYKNVRSEWATMVTTPPSAQFQDALAFTRSLGDLHLHMYGVTHRPEVKEYELKDLLDKVAPLKSTDDIGCLIMVCTDGVWDNWQYSDIMKYIVTTSSFSNMIQDSNLSAQKLTDEVMQENLKLARQHFGNQADNMTGVMCVISSAIK